MKKIKVHLDKKVQTSYDIVIGSGIRDRIGLMIMKDFQKARCVVITDSNVSTLHGRAFLEEMKALGLSVELVEFPAGEQSKNMATMLSVIKKLFDLGVDRNSLLIALGGGVVGDMTGFMASIYMRSVPYIQIPTTLLAQVDSSIGGKTAVDLPDGKNLLGTFYQPKAVFIDTAFLETLPDQEYKNGVAEIIKYGIIDSAEFFDAQEAGAEALKKRDPAQLLRLVEQSCRIKKGFVEIDEKDTGIRHVLNFGHTIGHAIEAESDFRVPHGYAVALGMIAISRICEKKYDLSKSERERIERLIAAFDLPTSIPADISTEGIMLRLQGDKKKKDGKVQFVLIKNIGKPFWNGGVDRELLVKTLEGMRS
ncbi:MAG: 3-dehydroquinate synthase [Deltaproteobacteria bacterium]|nr:3-dehydroquinate synthase [Deltaproteobacteria bacterium]